MMLWLVRPVPVATTEGHAVSLDGGLTLCGLSPTFHVVWTFATQRPAWPCTACLAVLDGTATRHSIARDIARAEAETDLADAQCHHDTERIAFRTQWLADHPPIIVSSGGSS